MLIYNCIRKGAIPMSFITNPVQQMTLDDSTFHLTSRELKALEKSWAKPFAEKFSRKLTRRYFVLFIAKITVRQTLLLTSLLVPVSSRNSLTCPTMKLSRTLCLMSVCSTHYTRQVSRSSRYLTKACPVSQALL